MVAHFEAFFPFAWQNLARGGSACTRAFMSVYAALIRSERAVVSKNFED